MTSRFIPPFYDVGSGVKPPLGALLYFFESDGVTPKDTHTTKAATTPNANPVVADSVGVFPAIYITGDYLVTLQDKNNVNQFSLAPVNEFATISDNAFVKNFLTLEGGPAATSAVENITAVVGDSIYVKERTSGNGGGSRWYAVLASSVTPNTHNIVISTGVPTIAWVLAQNPNNTIDMYGAQSAINSSSAITAAIAAHTGKLQAESSGYLIDSELLFTSGNCTGIKFNGQTETTLVKSFNGNVIRNEKQGATFSDFGIQGVSASYSGGGFYMVEDDSDIERVRVTDTTDACIIYKANDATYNTVTDSFLLAAVNGYAIRSDGADLSTSPSVRTFTRLKGGGPLVNFAGMNRAILTDSFGTLIGFDINSAKIGVHNNRFTNSSANLSVTGDDNVFTGNQFGFGAGFNLTFEATAEANTFDDSNQINIDGGTNNTCIDLSTTGNVGNTNSLYQPLAGFTFLLDGSTSPAVNGNSTAIALYSRNGRDITPNWSYVKGSTGTIAVGSWSLHLPFQALTTAVGTARVKSSAGVWYDVSIRVLGGSNQAFFSFPPDENLTDTSVTPFSTGSQIEASITYISA